MSAATGTVGFVTVPAVGVRIAAGFEFTVPACFDTETLDVTLDLERLGSIASIPVLEIRRGTTRPIFWRRCCPNSRPRGR